MAAGPHPAVFEGARAVTAVRNRRGNTDGLLYNVSFALGARVAMPVRHRDRAEADPGAGGTGFETWRGHVLGAKRNKSRGFLVFPCNGASAVCSAELVCGDAPKSRDFLYVHVGYFACGGLVIANALCTGRAGNAAVLASTRPWRKNSDLVFLNSIG